MIYSMTGYANRTLQIDNISLQIDIRSVNHRFFDLTIKCPEEFRQLEQLIREKISQRISRGKIDLRIHHTEVNNGNVKTELNKNMLEHYISISNQIQQYLPQTKLENIADILHLPGILHHQTVDSSEIQNILLAEIERLTDELLLSQQAEGEKLSLILKDKLSKVESITHDAQQIIPGILQTYRGKLKQKLFDILGEAMNNEQRFSQEFAYFCQKIDVNEELDRLNAHTEEFKTLLSKGGIIGKKIDFITQEMHREANTFGSKASALETSRQAVELKVLIEQVREQIQNIM